MFGQNSNQITEKKLFKPNFAQLAFILISLIITSYTSIYAQSGINALARDDVFIYRFGQSGQFDLWTNDVNPNGEAGRDNASQTYFHGDTIRIGPNGINYFPHLTTTYPQVPSSYGVDTFSYRNALYNGYSNTTIQSNFAKVYVFSIPVDGAENAGANCPVVAEPVNPTNGNMWIQHTDYILPGGGEPINITRFYNSILQSQPGLFGKGWSTEYDESLIAYDDRMIRINMPDGRAVYLGRNDTSTPFNISPSGFYGEAVKNQDNTYTLSFKDGRIHQFSAAGKLLWKKDHNGDQTTLAYDVNGNLTSITDAFGKALNVTINQGVITLLSDGLGVIANYAYNPDGTLQSVTRPDGSQYKFEYIIINSKPYLATVKDALDNVLETHLYDSQGRATTSEKHGGVEKYIFDYTNTSNTIPYTVVTDALGRTTNYYFDRSKGRNLITKTEGNCNCGSGSEVANFQYDDKLNLVKKIDALNRETSYTYDDSGNLLTETNALGTETYTYNNLGEILTRTDRMNGVTTNTYDIKGNLLTLTNPLNQAAALTYNASGQPVTVTDARNKTTVLAYDTAGRLGAVTDANNKTTVYNYDARSRLSSVTDALNQTTGFEYDAADRLKKVIHSDSSFIVYAYDLAGRQTGVLDERGNPTTYGYDNAYRLANVTDALNHTTNFGYDLMSKLTAQVDALGNITNYEYDNFDRLKKVIYPAASQGSARLEENLTYDVVGNVKTQTDTAGRITTYNYDNVNRLIETIDAMNKSTQFTYNARSQMTKVKDAANQEYFFSYDAVGRLLSQSRGGVTTGFEYDAGGNRTKRTDYNGQITNYAYDNLSRLTTISYQTPGTPQTASYAYDDLSRLASATNAAGTVSFAYDNRSRLTSTTDVHGKVLNYAYDATGNRTGLSIGNTQHTGYVYDAANRLTQLTDEANQNFNFGYDIANRLISKTLPNGITTGYNYDGMNRLTRLKDETASTVLFDRQYAYNPASQISQIAEPNQTKNYAYDLVDRLTQVSNPSNPVENYTYDSVGNRTASHLSATYTHQAFNRLAATANSGFNYDANGNRISKTEATGSWTYNWDFENRLTQVINPGGLIVSYQYDALGRRVKRTNGTQVEKFTYDGLDVVLNDDSVYGMTTYQNGLGIDNKLKSTNCDTVKYFLQDHLGSTTALADQTGAITAQTSYDSFGNATSYLPTSYQYTGREKDEFSGLFYYRARWYDSQLGKFISEDPIGFDGGDINLYGYVWNSPIKFSDPTGLDGWGNDKADSLDEKIEYARQFYQRDVQNWGWNGSVNTVADLAFGVSDLLRVGSGTGHALYDCDDNAYGRAANVMMDIERGAGIFSMLVGPFAKPSIGSIVKKQSFPIKTLEQQAQDLIPLNGGKNRVTLHTDKFQFDVDLAGASHDGIPTPHTKLSLRNFRSPGSKIRYNTSNKQALVESSTQQDIRLVRRYLERRR